MCGIVGIVETSPSKHERIDRMSQAIEHRGPDDSGYFEDGPLAFGFRRLAILDLSPAGHQPMQSSDGRFVIVFNGEIYNYRELAKELSARGCTFRSKTDTEVILAAFQTWGPDCVKRFNGMWAFAIWDRQRHELFCSRDRFGIKPFYYVIDKNQFVFGSEIKALLQHPNVSARMNPERTFDYLAYGHLDHTHQTMFEGIVQLPPAHSLRVQLGTAAKPYRYWDFPKEDEQLPNSDRNITDFRELFFNAVNLRLRSDVPVGSCLSGGLDSSSVVSVANKIIRDQRPENIREWQQVFTAVYDDPKINEHAYSRAVIDHTGVREHLIKPQVDGVARDLQSIIYHQDEPFGSATVVTQWYVMQLAHQAGIKVLLDGQGADEVLGGYHHYFPAFLAATLRSGHPIRFAREAVALGRNHQRSASALLIEGLRHFAFHLLPTYMQSRRKDAYSQTLTYLDSAFIQSAGGTRPMPSRYRDLFRNRLFHSFQNGLPALLHFEDRNSMAWSIEARVPFLDYRLVEFLFKLPSNQKITGGTTKYVLREAVRSELPSSVYARHTKLGFATPGASWLRGGLRPIVEEVFQSASFRSRDMIHSSEAQRVLKQFMNGQAAQSASVWRLLNFELWCRRFIDTATPSHD